MADTKLTDLTELEATPATDDVLYVADISAGTAGSRKIESRWFLRTDGSAAYMSGGGTVALGGFTLTMPASGTVVTLGAEQTLTNKTLGTPTITGGTVDSVTMGTPSITGGTIDSVTMGTPTVTGGTFDNVTLGTPTITGGTITGTTLSGTIESATLGTPTVIGGSIGTATITGGTITGATITDSDSTNISDGTASFNVKAFEIFNDGTNHEILPAGSITKKLRYEIIYYLSNFTAPYATATTGEIPVAGSDQYDELGINPGFASPTWRLYVGTGGDLYSNMGTGAQYHPGTAHITLFYI